MPEATLRRCPLGGRVAGVQGNYVGALGWAGSGEHLHNCSARSPHIDACRSGSRAHTQGSGAPLSRSCVIILRSGVLRRWRHRPPPILAFFVVPPTTPNEKWAHGSWKGRNSSPRSGEASPSVGHGRDATPLPDRGKHQPPWVMGGTQFPSTIFLSGEASPSVGESGSSRPNVVPCGNPLSLTLNLAFTPTSKNIVCSSDPV